MRTFFGFVIVLCLTLEMVVGPPVKLAGNTAEEDNKLEYSRYLDEILGALETDEHFKKKLDSFHPKNQSHEELASHLEIVSLGIRTKLDEIKRQELERLAELTKLRNLETGGEKHNELQSHLDHQNPWTFEKEDLEKLIKKTVKYLENLDAKRKAGFKQYEMEKEYAWRQKLKILDAAHKADALKQHDEMLRKHKEHPSVLHPGSEDQLKEVWEDQDHMDKDDFDPKTFFMMHDLDGDGTWSQNEIEALFQKELDKVYDPANEEDDMVERYEEMNRMREHVLDEMDTNQDLMISREEFLEATRKKDFDTNDPWKTLDQEDNFTDDEFEEFERNMNGEEDNADHLTGGEHHEDAQPAEHHEVDDTHHENVHHEQPGEKAHNPEHQQQREHPQQHHVSNVGAPATHNDPVPVHNQPEAGVHHDAQPAQPGRGDDGTHHEPAKDPEEPVHA